MATRHPIKPLSPRTTRPELRSYISSSPELPSLSDIIQKVPRKDPIRSGSNAAPIPPNATASFTTAASLYRSSIVQTIIDDDKDDQVLPENVPKRRGRPSGRRAASGFATAKVPVAEEPIEEVPLPAVAPKRRARKTVSKEASVPETTPSPEKPWLKFKISPEVPPLDVVDSTNIAPSRKRAVRPKKAAETVSRHFPPPKSAEPLPERAPEISNDEPWRAEPAMKRRTDWTPTKDTAPAQVSDSEDIRERGSPESDAVAGEQMPVFKNLSGRYGWGSEQASREASPAIPAMSANTEVFKKRKLVELVAVGDALATPVEPPKDKAPKKKPRTITELATAMYRVAEEAPDPSSSIRDYLIPTKDEAPAVATATGKRKVAKKAATRVSRKRAEPPKRLLLSPSSALKQASRQDILFGTSSQLATEDDPALLRALHEAMQASNLDVGTVGSSPPESDLWARTRAGTKLWKAGARDTDGSLLEIIDLVESSPERSSACDTDADSVPQVQPRMNLTGRSTSSAGVEILDLTETTHSSSRLPRPGSHLSTGQLTVDGAMSSAPSRPKTLAGGAETPSLTPVVPPTVDIIDLDTPVTIPRSNTIQLGHSSPLKKTDTMPQAVVAEQDLVGSEFEPPPSNQEHAQLQNTQKSASPQKLPTKPAVKSAVKSAAKPAVKPRTKPVAKSCPNYDLLTDAQLARKIKSFGFKPIKQRSAMIKILEQCWASQNKTASPSKPAAATEAPVAVPSAEVSATSAASPKRPRGRPPKDSTTANSKQAVAPAAPVKRARSQAKAKSPVLSTADSPPSAAKRPRGRPKKAAAGPSTTTAPIEIDSGPEETDLPSSPDMGVFSSPEPLNLSVGDDTEVSLAVDPTSREEQLFGFITKAVRTAPPTKDPLEPSWHEKMLLYDPIILEDLTAWLNSGQLDRVRFDEEVSPNEVKKWCESKSVCCLWRVNVHGKERKRF